MASRELSRLCRTILADVYGELASSIVGLLFDHGGLTTQQVVRYLKLPMPTVERALVALLQNRFVLYWQNSGSKSVVYYANWQQVYAVLWAGPIISSVNEMFLLSHGETVSAQSAEIVKNMHIYGHMKVQDYLDAHPPDQTDNIISTMTLLVRSKVLSPLNEFEFNPMQDIYQKLLQKHLRIVAEDRSGPQSEAARRAAATELAVKDREELITRKDAPNVGLVHLGNSISGISLAANMKLKRAARLNGSTNGSASDWSVDKDAALCVNTDKYLVFSRKVELVKLASTRVGEVSAKVYKALLECYEARLNRCSQNLASADDSNVATVQVSELLSETVQLEGTIVSEADSSKRRIKSEPISASKRLRTGPAGEFAVPLDEDNDDAFDYDDDDVVEASGSMSQNKRLELINRHLELLADSPIRFVRKAGNRGGGEWFVAFDDLAADLKRVTYDEVITNKYGPIAARLLRVVRDKGKVDEKLLSQITLLQAKDIRRHLTDLQNIGCLDLQEVPRSNDRAPGRSFYLWFHKPHRAYSLIVQDMYKAINHIYSRLISERKVHGILLAKLEREDVKGNEDAYLSSQERKELNELRRSQEKLLIQMFRIDRLVRIFRDY